MITLNDFNFFSFSPTVSPFDFCHEHGFRWIPSRNKCPLTSWKTKGQLYTPDDTQRASKYKAMGVSELLIPTEENNLVVIDCDRGGELEEKEHTMTGLYNFFHLLDEKDLKKYYFPIVQLFHPDDLNNPCTFACTKLDPPLLVPNDHPLRAMVFTPSGGMHFYFRCKNAGQIKSCASVIAPFVDIRARGGVIVSPYSYRQCDPVSKRDQNGKILISHYYLPLGRWDDIPELPDDLAKLLPHVEAEQAPARAPFLSLSFNRSTRASSYIGRLLDEYRKTPKGQRNTALSRLAGQAFRLSSYLSESVIYDAFKTVGQASGLSTSEVEATLESARKYGRNHQRKL